MVSLQSQGGSKDQYVPKAKGRQCGPPLSKRGPGPSSLATLLARGAEEPVGPLLVAHMDPAAVVVAPGSAEGLMSIGRRLEATTKEPVGRLLAVEVN